MIVNQVKVEMTTSFKFIFTLDTKYTLSNNDNLIIAFLCDNINFCKNKVIIGKLLTKN